jgi:hypothetical protein
MPDRGTLTRPQGMAIFLSYLKIAAVLKNLVGGDDGLAGVYVQSAHPRANTAEIRDQAMRHGGWAWIESTEQRITIGLNVISWASGTIPSTPMAKKDRRRVFGS